MRVLWTKVVALAVGSAALAGLASAQEFRGFQGSSQRLGHHDGNLATRHPDRAFLRWWDPLFGLSAVIDNWMAGTVQNPVNSYTAPNSGIVASFYEEQDPVNFHDPYVYVAPVASEISDNYWNPLPFGPGASTFSWIFGGLNPGEEYAVSVSIPTGPTDVDPTAAINLFYPAQYQVYEISGVVNSVNPGQPIYQKVDTYSVGGGWVRLGNDGQPTDIVYTVAPTSTSITVKLINTIPRDNNLELVDTRTNILVYADAARLERGLGSKGSIVSSPIVTNLQEAGVVFPWRVFAGRNEPTSVTIQNQLRDTSLGVLSSFRHNGLPVIAGDNVNRRNLVWSWPALRPVAITQAEDSRYAQERLEWMLGAGKYPTNVPRYNQSIRVDNLNAYAQGTAGFVASTVTAGFLGTDYLESTANVGAESVTYSPELREGSYGIEVWSPGGATFADGVSVLVRQGGTVIATTTVNMQTAGWNRVALNNITQWSSTTTAPLNIVITNAATGSGLVPADMVRFTTNADMAITSTPVYAHTTVNTPGGPQTKDVVIVAMENGRVYCLDAEGVNAAGVPTGDTTIYWAYPTEDSADPNWAAGLDGPDGLAEMPTGFDTSSALVETVGGQDRLYIASTNGRVYCLDLAGRGDGSTERVWTYPNDYPSPSVQSRLGAITGSLAFEVTAAGPTVFVPAPQGRLYALDAAGDNTTKTTTIRWTYPDLLANPIGPIQMTPAVGNGNIYFGTGVGSFAGNAELFAINVNDTNTDQIGDVVWNRTGSTGVPFIGFGLAGPALATAADVGAAQDHLFVANPNFYTYAFDANTGADIWESDEVLAAPSQSLGFTNLRLPNTASILTLTPTVIVPTIDGRYVAMYANVGRTNRLGGRKGAEIRLYGEDEAPAMAFGGFDPSVANPDDDENSWMYGADSAGYLYAWNYDPDYPDNLQQITPGIPPIDITFDQIDDDLSDRLDDIVGRAKASLITPLDYRTLFERQRAGTLTYADITAAINRVTRQHFEFGETLYYLVYDLPNPNFYATPTPYTVDLTFNSSRASSQRRTYSPFPVGAPPSADREYAALMQWTLLPNGGSALTPGRANFTLRILSQERQGANRTIPRTSVAPASPLPGGDIQLANPLSVGMVQAPVNVADHIGYTLDPTSPEAQYNGNVINQSPTVVKTIGKRFSTERTGPSEEVSHGQDAVTQVFVFDRSLLTLVYGPDRGLQSVRMQLGDLWWPTGVGVQKPFTQPQFDGLEDYPGSASNNISLDYPDIRTDRLNVTKTRFGAVENPLFQPVSLVPPSVNGADRTLYENDPATYNTFLNRAMLPTTFDFDCAVPKFQPPAKAADPNFSGYAGPQVVFVDSNQQGRDFSGNQALEAYRSFRLNADVAVDERLSQGKPSVDLNVIPGGGGFSPVAPWNNIAFSMLSPIFNDVRFPFFDRFVVFNEGNVNLLQVRVARSVQSDTGGGIDPVMFYGPTLANRALLDARWHLHTDMDERFLPAILGGSAVLQKARPGDSEPTRFRVNPKMRRNANLGTIDTDLFGTGSFATAQDFDESRRDPKISVSVPVGAPVGQFLQQIYTIEDYDNAPADRTFPTLNYNGGYEPYTEPPMTVQFTIRETRLTNRETSKAAPMVDALGLSPTEPLTWSNGNPSPIRTGTGNLFVAFASDRLDSGNTPAFLARPKVNADTAARKSGRIYIASLVQGAATPTAAVSAISDLSGFGNATANRWFVHALEGYPTTAPGTLFGVPTAELDLGSLSFYHPTFPAAGTFEPLSGTGANGKRERGSVYMTFIGSIDRTLPSGERRRENRLFISTITPAANGTLTAGAPIPAVINGQIIDPQATFGKPSIVQNGSTAVVFYTLSSSSTSQIVWSYFDGRDWAQLGFGPRTSLAETMRLGTAFESATSPSASLRAYRGVSTNGRIELLFGGRVKGRSQEEVYLARINLDGSGRPTFQGNSQSYTVPFGVRLDRLTSDPKTGLFWGPGVDLRTTQNDLNAVPEVPTNPLSASFIDVKRFNSATGQWQTVLDHSKRRNEEGSSVYAYDCIFGGTAYIDTAAGSVRFSGAMVPANTVLYIRSIPRVMRIGGQEGQNYRSPNMVFDEHYVGDNGYWLTTANLGMPLGSAARNDRFILSYAKTSSINSDRTRPYLKTLRFGGKLPSAIATDSNGIVTSLTVTGANTPFQVEPSTGKIYFMAEMEDQTVSVTYRGVDEHGRDLGVQTATFTVTLIEETPEGSIPMNDVANETAVTLGQDPYGGSFNVGSGNWPFNSVNAATRRPGLIWMFWTSTRGGGADVYFQTLSPKFGSVQAGN